MTATKRASGSALDGYWGSGTTFPVRDNEQSATKRAFTKTKLPKFVYHADDKVALFAASGREAWLPAHRNALMFKLAYSYDGKQARWVEEDYAVRLNPLLNRHIVLENGVVVGSVDANLRHYRQAADVLARADNEWLDRLITRRVPLQNAAEAYQPAVGDVRVVDLDGRS